MFLQNIRMITLKKKNVQFSHGFRICYVLTHCCYYCYCQHWWPSFKFHVLSFHRHKLVCIQSSTNRALTIQNIHKLEKKKKTKNNTQTNVTTHKHCDSEEKEIHNLNCLHFGSLVLFSIHVDSAVKLPSSECCAVGFDSKTKQQQNMFETHFAIVTLQSKLYVALDLYGIQFWSENNKPFHLQLNNKSFCVVCCLFRFGSSSMDVTKKERMKNSK